MCVCVCARKILCVNKWGASAIDRVYKHHMFTYLCVTRSRINKNADYLLNTSFYFFTSLATLKNCDTAKQCLWITLQ